MKSSRSNRRLAAAIALGLLTTSWTTGCVWAPELSRVKNEIARDMPDVEFDHEFSLSLGPLTIGFARLVTGVIPDAREARDYLRDVSRVKLAVYNIKGNANTANVRTPRALQKLVDKGWENAVRVREDDEYVWVFYRAQDNAVREVYVIVLDDEQLVLVKARGRLDRMVARALENHPDEHWTLRGTRADKGGEI